MKDNKSNISYNFKEDSIDVIEILKKVWSERKFIFKVILTFFIKLIRPQKKMALSKLVLNFSLLRIF